MTLLTFQTFLHVCLITYETIQMLIAVFNMKLMAFKLCSLNTYNVPIFL